MGIIDDFKRLFWVKKAVAESAAEKAVDKGKEIAHDFSEKASDTWEKGKKVATDLGEKVTAKAKDFSDDWTQKQKTENTMEKPNPEKGKENLTDSNDDQNLTWDKAKETGKEVLDKAKETGKEVLDKAVKASDKAWEKVEDVSEDLWDKAKNVAGNLHKKANETMDSMLEKSKELDKKIQEERDKIDPNRDGWADQSLHDKLKEHDSTLKGKDKDDFFEKASRYADGDYSMGKPTVSRTKNEENDEETEEGEVLLPPLPKKDNFDDAIIDDDDKKE